MIKVANIIEEGKLGGPQIRMVLVAVALKSKLETVMLMPSQNSDAFRNLCQAQDVQFRVLPLSRITKELRVALGYILFLPFEILMLAWVFHREKVDLVHVSGGSWQFKGVIAAWLVGKKVLWHLNDTYMPGFIRKVFAVICPLSDGFIFASERSKAYYKPLITKRMDEFVIPAPVDTMRFDPKYEHSGDEEFLQALNGKFVVGTVANINPIKGLETFILGASLLNVHLDNVLFVVVGPVFQNQKRYFDTLRQLCDDLAVTNILFVGGRTDIRPILNRFDIYVCSSDAESSPISVWEAMAMAKPVVSTNVGDVPLYVRDGVNGYIVDVGDSDALAERLFRLAEDKALREAFGGHCRDVAMQKLDVSRCAELHLKAYNAVLE